MGTMSKKNRTPALAYLRTSSSTNVGADKDSDKRQREAIATFAKRAGHELVGEYYDQAVRGADALDGRPGFAAMLEHIAGNGARTIIVETANRFARDLIVQETGHRMLKGKGIEIIAADSPTAVVDATPTAPFVRPVLGAVAQLDKAMRVAKLRGRARAQASWLVRGRSATARSPPRGCTPGQAAPQSQSCNRSAPFAAIPDAPVIINGRVEATFRSLGRRKSPQLLGYLRRVA